MRRKPSTGVFSFVCPGKSNKVDSTYLINMLRRYIFTGIIVLQVILQGSVIAQNEDIQVSHKNEFQSYSEINKEIDRLNRIIDSGEGEKVKYICQEALDQDRIVSDGTKIIGWNALGYYHLQTGNYDSSIYCFSQGLELEGDLIYNINLDEKWHYLRKTHHLLGMAYEFAGRWNRACDSYKNALKCSDRIIPVDSVFNAIILLNVGSVYQRTGDFYFAKGYFEEAIKYLEGNDEEILLAYAFNNFGTVLAETEETRQAILMLDRSYHLLSKYYDIKHPEMGHYYANKGRTLSEIDYLKQAHSSMLKAIKIFKSSFPYELSACFFDLGNIFMKNGLTDSSIFYFSKCLHLRDSLFGKKHPEIAETLNSIGMLYEEQGDFTTAFEFFKKAITANLAGITSDDLLQDPKNLSLGFSMQELSISLAGLLQCDLELNRTELNRKILMDLLMASLDRIYSSHHSLESKYYTTKKNKDILSRVIVSIIEKNDSLNDDPVLQEQLFKLIECCKANTLEHIIFTSKVRRESPVPDSLVDLEQLLLLRKNKLLSHLNSSIISGKTMQHKSVKMLKSKIFQLSMDLMELSQIIDSIATGKHQRLPSPDELIKCLDVDEAILDYFIKDSLLVVIVINHNGLFVYSDVEKDLKNEVQCCMRSIKLSDPVPFKNHSEKLCNSLFMPLLGCLEGMSRLIILPDEYLFYLPFEALIMTQDDLAGSYLISEYETIYGYSATFWMQLKSAPMWTGINQVKNFAGFAPVFKGEFPFCDQHHRNIDKFSLRTFLGPDGYIRELPFSGQEVDTISRILSEKGIFINKYLEYNATENNFKAETSFCDIIHIATHGFFNDEYGLGGLVFFQDRQRDLELFDGSADIHEDGILYPEELVDYCNSNKLIVLSCCESGLGRIVGGEGIISLAHGFLGSGTSNIVISLWKISDVHTMDFMTRFYSSLVEGENPSAALRSAKLDILKASNKSFQKLWAPFIIFGP